MHEKVNDLLEKPETVQEGIDLAVDMMTRHSDSMPEDIYQSVSQCIETFANSHFQDLKRRVESGDTDKSLPSALAAFTKTLREVTMVFSAEIDWPQNLEAEHVELVRLASASTFCTDATNNADDIVESLKKAPDQPPTVKLVSALRDNFSQVAAKQTLANSQDRISPPSYIHSILMLYHVCKDVDLLVSEGEAFVGT